MQLKMESGSVPVGTYAAVFLGVEPQEADDVRGFGAGLRWRWKIEAGPCAGLIASRITGPTPSPKNACGSILCALAGRPVAQGESVDPASFVGKKYTIIVAAGKMNPASTRVETCVPTTAAY